MIDSQKRDPSQSSLCSQILQDSPLPGLIGCGYFLQTLIQHYPIPRRKSRKHLFDPFLVPRQAVDYIWFKGVPVALASIARITRHSAQTHAILTRAACHLRKRVLADLDHPVLFSCPTIQIRDHRHQTLVCIHHHTRVGTPINHGSAEQMPAIRAYH